MKDYVQLHFLWLYHISDFLTYPLPFLFFRGETAVSLECDDNGSPLLQMSPPDITVHSFHHLSNLLQLSKDKKMNEIQACLEGELHAVLL